jgi:hypothetical protein
MSRLQQMIEEAVVALTAFDSHALERIQAEMQGLVAAPLSSADAATVLPLHRLLGALLQETERNLKLFRINSLSARQPEDTGCYAFPLR